MTDRRFMTDRLYKQLEAFAICGNRREDFRLAEIDSPEKSLEVRKFLLRTEYGTAWPAGRTAACPFRDYVWGKDGQERPMNYTNWRFYSNVTICSTSGKLKCGNY
ncbi:unnamed protein product [Allacma fusca]|uniref:Uncharacterized protein n=1 Tax=Allacma fusca TaxID=39272 RepID=A0A8J2NUE0_9HEXA|nr:unnamed protein product [Allacma fusca]